MDNIPVLHDLQDMADAKLARLFQSGNGEAAAVLISRYIRLINKFAFSYSGILDFDDLAQEGCIGLLDAANSYDPGRSPSFAGYASACIRNRILKAIEKNSSQKAGALNHSVSLDELPERPDELTPEKIFIHKESLETVLSEVNRLLSPMERKILYFHLGGFDYQTIADTLHISSKSVDNALQRVRRKLKSISRA